MEEIEKLRVKIAEYEKRMGIGNSDPAKDGYLVMVNILVQQNEYLKTVKIKDMITSEEKGKSNEYERAKALWEKLPTMIHSVSELRIELKMDGEENKNYYSPISAKEIANGNV